MSWWTNPNLQPKTKSKFVVVFGGSFYLPNIKSLNKPKVEFDTKEYRLLNHKFNYPGNATWQPITMKFVDMNGMGMQTDHFDTGAFLWQIMNNTGYTYPHVNNSQFRDPHFRNVDNEGDEEGGGHHIATKISFRDDPDTVDIEEFNTWKTITTPEKSSTIANSFGLGLSGVADYKNAATSKQKISIYQISPDKKITECWHLINPIVKTIGWGELDYSADELVEYELGVVYDWAVMDRTQIGKPMNVDELSYKEFMKTLFVDNPEAFTQEKLDIAETDFEAPVGTIRKIGDSIDLNGDGKISDLEKRLSTDKGVIAATSDAVAASDKLIKEIAENVAEQSDRMEQKRLAGGIPALTTRPEGSAILDTNLDLGGVIGTKEIQAGSGGLGAGGDIGGGGDVSPLGPAGEVPRRREGTERQVGGTPEIQTRGSGGTVDLIVPLVASEDTPNPFDRTTPLGQEE